MESYKNNSRNVHESKEQLRKLSGARQEVEHIIDKLGMGIDEEIKETVAILRAMEFPTSSSCAGHTDKDGYSPPYVEIYTKAPEDWKEDKTKQALWREENLNHRARLELLLNEFYKNRTTPFDTHLHLSDIGVLGGFRLNSVGTLMKIKDLGIKTQEEIFNRIRAYQNEMKSFTDFIREKFLRNRIS